MSWGADVDDLVAEAAITVTSGNYPMVGVATPMISAVILVIGDATLMIGVIPTTSFSNRLLETLL